MRIATISEGQTEYACLPPLYAQIKASTGHILLNPTYARIPPDAPAQRVAKECVRALRVAAIQRPDLIVILLDREQVADSAGVIAQKIEKAISDIDTFSFSVRVVIKDRMFENWLIADLGALDAQPRRFSVSDSMRRQVQPNKADRVEALDFLKRASQNRQYDKVNDGKRTAAHVNVERAASHSRSFRHFLHVLEHPMYSTQCRRPEAA